jgi:hypothetical protein
MSYKIDTVLSWTVGSDVICQHIIGASCGRGVVNLNNSLLTMTALELAFSACSWVRLELLESKPFPYPNIGEIAVVQTIMSSFGVTRVSRPKSQPDPKSGMTFLYFRKSIK